MPVPMLRPLGFGEILDGAISLYRRHLAAFFMTAFLSTLTFALAGFAGMLLAGVAAAFGLIAGAVLIAWSAMIMWGALTHQASAAVLSGPVPPRDAVRAGMRSALPLLGVVFLHGIAMAVCVLIMLFLAGMAALVIGPTARAGELVVGLLVLGSLSFAYVAGAAVLAGAGPVVVAEGKGPLEGLRRSVELMSGAFWRTAGLVMVTGMITYLPLLALLVATGAASAMESPAPDAASPASVFSGVLVLWWALLLVVSPFVASVFVLAHYDRRVRTEALDLHLMAESLAIPSPGDASLPAPAV